VRRRTENTEAREIPETAVGKYRGEHKGATIRVMADGKVLEYSDQHRTPVDVLDPDYVQG
jgi:hypothetical protein